MVEDTRPDIDECLQRIVLTDVFLGSSLVNEHNKDMIVKKIS
jgi:hypothetical protein